MNHNNYFSAPDEYAEDLKNFEAYALLEQGEQFGKIILTP